MNKAENKYGITSLANDAAKFFNVEVGNKQEGVKNNWSQIAGSADNDSNLEISIAPASSDDAWAEVGIKNNWINFSIAN